MTKQKLKQNILKKIQGGEVKMIPKWRFELVDKSQKGLWVAMMLMSSMAFTMILIFIKEYEIWSMRELGEIGGQLIVEDFPYGWLIGGVGLMIISKLLVDKIGDNYKKSQAKIWGVTLVLTLIFIVVLDRVW